MANARKQQRNTERIDWEIGFYEGIARRDPEWTAVLRPLAEHYTRRGRHEEGLAVDRQLARLCPDDPIAQYNLACSLSLTGDVGGALESLTRACDLGYDDGAWMERDPDLRAVREDPRYRVFLRRRGLAIAPDPPPADGDDDLTDAS